MSSNERTPSKGEKGANEETVKQWTKQDRKALDALPPSMGTGPSGPAVALVGKFRCVYRVLPLRARPFAVLEDCPHKQSS